MSREFGICGEISSSGGSLPKLAPDLSRLSTLSSGLPTVSVTGLNPSAGSIVALSGSGKYALGTLYFSGLTAETVTISLTIDGVLIFNETFTANTTLNVLGSLSTTRSDTFYQCDTSFSLDIETATDNNVSLEYLIRPLI